MFMKLTPDQDANYDSDAVDQTRPIHNAAEK